MTTYRFQQITRSRKVLMNCDVCGKLRTRSLTVTYTINPYNRNQDGSVRTPQEVVSCVAQELEKQVAQLKADGITCKVCEKGKENQ